ncbi:MAG TPA: hypothetical protein VGP07_22985 [Polyangia bacterium]
MSILLALPLSACGGDRPSALETDVSAQAAVSPPPPASTTLPTITKLADGSSVMVPKVGDVAMLQRQPDGSYKRICQKPDGDTRTMLEGMMRARRRAQ